MEPNDFTGGESIKKRQEENQATIKVERKMIYELQQALLSLSAILDNKLNPFNSLPEHKKIILRKRREVVGEWIEILENVKDN